MNDIQLIMTSFAGHVPFGRWGSHNCPACHHNGQPRPDTRSRGGAKIEGDGSYTFNCFNCRYHASWQPGMPISKRLQDLATWYGASNMQIMQMVLIADEMRKSGKYDIETKTNSAKIYQHIEPRDMPKGAKTFEEILEMDPEDVPPGFMDVLSGMIERNEHILGCGDFWYSSDHNHNLNTRFLIPFIMHGKIIGYTGRSVDPKVNQRYFNQYPSHVMFNFDLLNDPKLETVLVLEGPIDAMLVGGVAVCHYSMRENHVEWLKKCNKDIVIVPDRDKDGLVMIDQAIRNGFSVSLPDWGTHQVDGRPVPIKDVDEATKKYGRLYTRYMIGKSIYRDEFEIRARTAQWF